MAEKKKIVIIGATGLLGSALAKAFADLEPTLLTHADIELTDRQQLEKKFYAVQPDVVINAAGFTQVDDAESREDEATLVNGIASGYLAEACKQLDTMVVWFSTDYVFDGKNKAGYREDDTPNPVNAYGRSKLRGEQEIQKHGRKFYIIRTSLLFGPDGRNFVKNIVEKAKVNETIRVITDQWAKPTYTTDLAARTRRLIESSQPFGIYHLTNQAPDGGVSRFELAQEAVKILGLPTNVEPTDSSEFPVPAKRPHYSGLVNTKVEEARSWQEALKEFLKI